MDLTPVGAKEQYPKTLTLPIESSKRKQKSEKSTYQRIRSQTQVFQTHHQDNLYLLSSEKSDYLDDESENLGSDSGSSGRYSFRFFCLRFDDSVGSVSVLGYCSFAPTGVKSRGDMFCLTCSYKQELSPEVVESSRCFGTQITYFISKFETKFHSYSRIQTLPHSIKPMQFHQRYEYAQSNGNQM